MRLYFLATLLFGFSAQAFSELIALSANLGVKEGIYYLQNEGRPYTGYAEAYYKNGQIKYRESFRDGVKHGKETTWYEDGKLKSIVVYKSGNPQSFGSSWYTNQGIVKQNKSAFLSCADLKQDSASFGALCGTSTKSKPTYIEFEN